MILYNIILAVLIWLLILSVIFCLIWWLGWNDERKERGGKNDHRKV